VSTEISPQRLALLEINEMVAGADDIFPSAVEALAAIWSTTSTALAEPDPAPAVDQTVDALKSLQAFAAENGAVIDRVEVTLRDTPEGELVAFTAHLLPRPLPNGSQACLGYFAHTSAESARPSIEGTAQ